MMLTGRWTYRSYLNVTDLVGGDAPAALSLIVREGVFDLSQTADGQVEGALGFDTGVALRISGTAWAISDGIGFALRGTGLDGTATAAWRYAYRGVAFHPWPDPAAQVPTMLGNVLRLAPDRADAEPAALSFIAVRHGDAPPPRTQRPPSRLLR